MRRTNAASLHHGIGGLLPASPTAIWGSVATVCLLFLLLQWPRAPINGGAPGTRGRQPARPDKVSLELFVMSR